jgi:hypothetical protein
MRNRHGLLSATLVAFTGLVSAANAAQDRDSRNSSPGGKDLKAASFSGEERVNAISPSTALRALPETRSEKWIAPRTRETRTALTTIDKFATAAGTTVRPALHDPGSNKRLLSDTGPAAVVNVLGPEAALIDQLDDVTKTRSRWLRDRNEGRDRELQLPFSRSRRD